MILKINEKSYTERSTLVIVGTATSNRFDRDNESITISPNAWKQAFYEYVDGDGKVYDDKRNALGLKIIGEHQKWSGGDRQLGLTLLAIYTPDNYEIDSPDILDMKIKIVAEISDPEAIELINKGIWGALSLNWGTYTYLINPKTNQRIDTSVILHELSLVRMPANPDAQLKVVTDNDLLQQYQKVKAFGELATVKNMYYGEDDNIYVDLEYDNTIVNHKSASGILLSDVKPLISIPDYAVTIKKNWTAHIKV